VGVSFQNMRKSLQAAERPDASCIGIRALRKGATFVFLTPLRKHGTLRVEDSNPRYEAWHCLRSEAQEYELHTVRI
jgi:hypothetical protein